MARSVANVDILTETFEAWLLKTNGLLHSLSTEIITANSTWGYTGNTSVPRQGQLIGTFAANAVFVGETLSGGRANSTPGSSATVSANLNIVSNVNISAVTVNSAANSRYTNTAFFEANVQANGALVTIVPLGNTDARATELTVNTNTITVRTANLDVRSNTSFSAIRVVNDSTTTNTSIAGNNLNISANLVVSSFNHTVAGNTNFDSGSLFVDGTNNRVGIRTTTPDTELTVVGSANVIGNTWVGDRFTVVGNSSVTSGIVTVTTNTTNSANVVTVVAANVNIDSGALFVDQTTNRTGINTTTPDASLQVVGQANVSGAVRFANSLAVVGNTTLSNTLAVTGNTTLSNTLTVAGNVALNSTGLHTIAGNVNFDTGTLFVDSVNNRLGVNTTTPDTAVTIVGAANVSANVWVGGNASLTSGILLVNSAASSVNTVAIVGANVNIDSGVLFVDQIANRVGVNTTTPDAALNVQGAANVTANVWIGGTANVVGNVTIQGTSHLISGNSNFDSGVLFVDSILNRVGIGTTAPDTALQVIGSANVSVDARIGGNTTIAGASHTVAGNTNFDGGTLFIDSANDRVGLGTTTPNARLSISGASNTSGAVWVGGNASFATGILTVNATTGNANTVVINNANVNIDSGALFVDQNTNRIGINTTTPNASLQVEGQANVSGATRLANTLAVIGATTLSNTLSVAGAANVLSTFGVTGAANVLSTLGVTGAANLSSTLGVVGLTTLSGAMNTTTANASVAVNVGGNVNITTADVTVGNSSVNTFISSTLIDTDGRLAVLGNTTLSNTLNVVGAANLQLSVNVGTTLGVQGAATLANTIAVTGNAIFSNTVAITGNTTLSNTLLVTGNTTLSNTLVVAGLTSLNGGVNTTTANASVAVNVGANVIANTTTLRTGNASVFSAMTSSQIVTTGTLSVTGNTSLQANVTIGGTLDVPTLRVTSGLVMEGDYSIDIVTNTNIGTSTSTPIVIFQFPRGDHRSGKIMVQVTNGSNTQMSEMVIAHNNTDAYITVYGTVASPPGANNFNALLGNFTSSINSTSNAVELFLQQTQANSAVKVVAHLVK